MYVLILLWVCRRDAFVGIGSNIAIREKTALDAMVHGTEGGEFQACLGGFGHSEYRTFAYDYYSPQEGGRKMRFRTILALALVLVFATSAFAFEAKMQKARKDIGVVPLGDCYLSYYYHCPEPGTGLAYYWYVNTWDENDIFGTCYNIGDQGYGGDPACDPTLAQSLSRILFVEGSGACGGAYPGANSCELDVYCAPEYCCGPTAPVVHLWNSGPYECNVGWNYLEIDPPLCLTDCCLDPQPDCNPSIVVTITMTGYEHIYPEIAFDCPYAVALFGYPWHDIGCLPAVVPRGPCGGPAPAVHGGYIGSYPFQYWPPFPLCDFADSTPDCTQFGYIEWRCTIDLLHSGPTATETSTWGNIKSMYE